MSLDVGESRSTRKEHLFLTLTPYRNWLNCRASLTWQLQVLACLRSLHSSPQSFLFGVRNGFRACIVLPCKSAGHINKPVGASKAAKVPPATATVVAFIIVYKVIIWEELALLVCYAMAARCFAFRCTVSLVPPFPEEMSSKCSSLIIRAAP